MTAPGITNHLLAFGDVRDVPARLALPAGCAVVLLAIDARAVPDEDVERIVGALMDAGAVAFVCAGPDADRVERLVDAVAIPREAADAPVIWTTSHEAGGLDEALAFFLGAAEPAEAYVPAWTSRVAVVVGNDLWAAAVKRAFAAA